MIPPPAAGRSRAAQLGVDTRRDGGEMSSECLRMNVERHVLPYDSNAISVDLFDLLEGRTDPRAEGHWKSADSTIVTGA